MFLNFWSFILWYFSSYTVAVPSQTNSQGFISIDCGIAEGYAYNDENTNLQYISDVPYIHTGTNYNISMSYITNSLQTQLSSLRSFPNGSRNCYSLGPVLMGIKYLLRAMFMYGNYDGLKKPILFDLHLGVNLWKTMNILDVLSVYTAEVVSVAEAEFVSVCLVNTNMGTPFVSSLEMRPLKTYMYPGVNASS